MSKRMTLAEYKRTVKWPTGEKAAKMLENDLSAMKANISPYDAVPDTQAARSLIPQGQTNRLGEHDPELRKEIRHSVF